MLIIADKLLVRSRVSAGMSMRIRTDKLSGACRKKKNIARAAEITEYTMAKFRKNQPVQMEVMIRLCKEVHCDIDELMEIIED